MRRLLKFAWTGLLWVAATNASPSDLVKTITLTVHDPRPLAEVAKQLEGLSGVPINYEDAQYAHASDVQDVTEAMVRPEARAANPGKIFRVLIPRGGELSVPVTIDSRTNKPADLVAALHSAVEAHAAQGFPGTYLVKQVDGGLSITPAGVRDASGAIKPATSVLDTPVTFAVLNRSAALTLQLILDEVGKASGCPLGMGFAVNGLILQTVTMGAQNEPAADVLRRLFTTVAPRKSANGEPTTVLSYHLFFDPGSRSYGFNLDFVQPPQQAQVAAEPGKTDSTRFFQSTAGK